MSDPTKVHVHTSDDGPCGYCSGDDCPMRYCPGCPPGCALAEDEPSGDDCSMRYCPACHGSGTELSGTTHAGLAEQLPCDDCGPDCPQDCGCRVDAGTAVPRLLAEREALTTDLAEARATISRLNARAQVAEAAIAELTGTGKGKGRKVAREVWTRCEESHGQACRTTRQARAWAVALEAENARLREGIERLVSDLDNPLRERDSAAPQDMPEVAEDLRALLADTDSAREDDGGE